MTPLEVAQGEIGYVEQGGPDGRSGNITKYWDWWDAECDERDQGASWCGCFVSWSFDQAGVRFSNADSHQGPGFIYCPGGEAWFRSQGLLVDAAHAQPNDVAFFHFVGEAIEANHTGIVESVDPANQTITCIEGNTSSGTVGNQSNGGGVYRRTRPWSCVRSAGHPAWIKGDDEVTDQDKQDIINGVVAAIAGAPNVAGARLDLAQMLAFIQGDAFNGAKYDLNHIAQLVIQQKA